MLFDIFDARARPGRSPRRGAPSARRARRRPRLALALALVALVAISTRESHADGLDYDIISLRNGEFAVSHAGL